MTFAVSVNVIPSLFYHRFFLTTKTIISAINTFISLLAVSCILCKSNKYLSLFSTLHSISN